MPALGRFRLVTKPDWMVTKKWNCWSRGTGKSMFDRVANSEKEKRPLFDVDARSEYASALQRPVATDEVQRVVNEMLACNFIMRIAHGTYRVSDPFVQKVWLEINEVKDRNGDDEGIL
jgi:hypothetical protein